MTILKSSNNAQKRGNVLISLWHQFKHFCPKFNAPFFFQTPLIKADEKLQASPDVGGSPDTSDTGFEEAMDVSDGNSDFIFWACFGKLFDQGFII